MPVFADQVPKFVKHKRTDMLTPGPQDQPRVPDADEAKPFVGGVGMSVGQHVVAQWIPVDAAGANHDRAHTILLLKADKGHGAPTISTLNGADFSEAERPILIAELLALVKEGHWHHKRWQGRSKEPLRPIKLTRCRVCNKPILSVKGTRTLCRTQPWMLVGTSCRAIWRNGGVPRVLSMARMLRKTKGGSEIADDDDGWVPPTIRERY